MEVVSIEKGNYLLISLKGKLDAYHSEDIEDKLLPLIENYNKNFIIDFSEVDYISSAGLRLFMKISKMLEKTKKQIVFTYVNKHLTEIFEITGFNTIFKIFPDEESAADSFLS